MQYEPDIEQRLDYLRANAAKLVVFYIKNFADKGFTIFLEALNYVVSQTSRATKKGVSLKNLGLFYSIFLCFMKE
jgi:receptor expression-enhancing protein 1/2/3/4